MAEQKAVDSFGTFLKSVKKKAANASDNSSLKVLHALETGPLPLPELYKKAGLNLELFAGTLQTVRKLDLVKVEDQAGTEIAELTPEGREFAKLAES
jgi:hypothetical protein